MEIFQVLKKDHRDALCLIERMLKGKEASLDSAFSRLFHELAAHMELEEQFLYPVLQREGDTREHVFEAFEEHGVAKKLMDDMQQLAKSDERWSAKLQVLNEVLDHHIKEEEGILFKKANRRISRESAQQMLDHYGPIKEKHMAMA